MIECQWSTERSILVSPSAGVWGEQEPPVYSSGRLDKVFGCVARDLLLKKKSSSHSSKHHERIRFRSWCRDPRIRKRSFGCGSPSHWGSIVDHVVLAPAPSLLAVTPQYWPAPSRLSGVSAPAARRRYTEGSFVLSGPQKGHSRGLVEPCNFPPKATAPEGVPPQRGRGAQSRRRI